MIKNWFSIPFTIGLYFILIYCVYKFAMWIKKLDSTDKAKIINSLFTFKTIAALKEVFYEGLIHRKIFKTNPLLGFMHMTFAFGWFLIIVIGHIELWCYSGKIINEPFFSIFFRYYQPRFTTQVALAPVFDFVMDFLLLLIISGIILAIVKRGWSRFFGIKKTTKHALPDRIATASLWLIFPLRLVAELFTAARHSNGSFIIDSLSTIVAQIPDYQMFERPFYFMYSISLFAFFVTLPLSRYMHIPTEILLIFLRNYGVCAKKGNKVFSDIEIHSCSRCGICVDNCQMSLAAQTKPTTAVAFVRSVRAGKANLTDTFNCLMCGSCQNACPVGIDTLNLRIEERNKFVKEDRNNLYFNYLPETVANEAKVVYFAGCMSHLTPSTKQSMQIILKEAGVNYSLLDENDSICCGRPMKLSGNFDAAKALINKNKQIILSSKAKILVTSCPICFKSFKEDYDLEIKVLHHTQYINELVKKGKITLQKETKEVVYHDPCELGRGSGIYEEPRNVIKQIADLQIIDKEKSQSVCCGGSIAGITLTNKQRDVITRSALADLTQHEPDEIITSCPLCKKTFSRLSSIKVSDISEIVAESLIKQKEMNKSLYFSEEETAHAELIS